MELLAVALSYRFRSVARRSKKINFLTLAMALSSLAILAGCGKSTDVEATSTSSSTPSVTANTSSSSSNPNYNLGDVIKFGAGGSSEHFRQEGWSGTEQNFTWTSGFSAKLIVPVPESDRSSLSLRMRLSGITRPPSLTFQPVELLVNGQKVAEWQVGPQPQDYVAAIPADVVRRDRNLTIELKTPKAVSPKSEGMSGDPRTLGVACFELSIE